MVLHTRRAKAKVDEEATKAKQLIDQASTNDVHTKLEIMK